MSRDEALKTLFWRHGDETAVMNYLQNHGLVSDNAVWLADCASADLIAAAEGRVT